MQSVLRACFELRSWPFRIPKTNGLRIWEALDTNGYWNDIKSQATWSLKWHLDDGSSGKTLPDHRETRRRLMCAAISTEQSRVSTLDFVIRNSFFRKQNSSRLYSVQPDCDLSNLPAQVQKRFRRIFEDELSDDELREIWRDVLESSGAGEHSLPVAGEAADRIWNTLISLGTRDITIMEELCAYSARLWEIERRERPSFYADVISALIKNKQHGTALRLHKELQRQVDVGSSDLLRVFREACSTSADYSCFQEIYSSLPNLQLHDAIVDFLCSQSRLHDAMTMHNFLMGRKDYPRDIELLRHLHIFSMTLQPEIGKEFRKQLARIGIHEFDESAVQPFPGKKQRLSDAFVARLFATRSFSVQFISNIIAAFGTVRLEPVTIHQLCVRSDTATRLAENIQIMSEYGISLGSSITAQMAKKIAEEQNEMLLAEIKSSDMDPGALDDLELQKSLFLLRYFRREDSQTEFSKIVLQMHKFGDQMMFRLLLRDTLSRKDWHRAVEILKTAKGGFVTRPTVDYIVDEALNPDNLEKKDMWGAAELGLALWQYFEKTRYHSQLMSWERPLQLLEQTGRIADLERLIYWVASNSMQARRIYRRPSDIGRLFTKQFQANLVARGFKHVDAQLFRRPRRYMEGGIVSEDVAMDTCTFGIKVLNQLKNQFEVFVWDEVVTAQLSYWLRVFVDKGHRFGKEEESWTTIKNIVKRSNSIWGEELLPESDYKLRQRLLPVRS